MKHPAPIVTELTSSPEVGRYYLVPSIYMARFTGRPAIWWPVHGSLHEDADISIFRRRIDTSISGS